MKRKPSLETVSNIVIIIAGVACVVGWARYLMIRPAIAANSAPPYAIGQSLAGVSEVEALPPKRTLVLYISSTCHFCSASMPFYRRLVAARAAAQSETRVVAFSRDPGRIVTTYLDENALNVDQSVPVAESSSLKFQLTPTLVLLDGQRKVLRIWVGQLSAGDEADVLKQVLNRSS